MKDQGRGPATYVVPWAPHLLKLGAGVRQLLPRRSPRKRPQEQVGEEEASEQAKDAGLHGQASESEPVWHLICTPHI